MHFLSANFTKIGRGKLDIAESLVPEFDEAVCSVEQIGTISPTFLTEGTRYLVSRSFFMLKGRPSYFKQYGSCCMYS